MFKIVEQKYVQDKNEWINLDMELPHPYGTFDKLNFVSSFV